MGWLAPIASLVGLEVGELVGRLKRNAIAWSVIGLFALIGLIFLLVAANAALTATLGPVWAPAAIAAGALAVALCVLVGIKIAEAIAARREAERDKAAARTALATTAVMTALPLALRLDLVRKFGLPVGGALAVAYFLTRTGRGGPTSGDDRPADTPGDAS
jgi:hypothetical protein